MQHKIMQQFIQKHVQYVDIQQQNHIHIAEMNVQNVVIQKHVHMYQAIGKLAHQAIGKYVQNVKK